MPVGARQLGMGETALALADDVFATYWNPAGLAFGPLADEWELSFSRTSTPTLPNFTALGSKEKTGFLSKTALWSGTRDGLMHYDGKAWKTFHEHVFEQGEQLPKVIADFVGNIENTDSLTKIVLKFNGLKSLKEAEDQVSIKLPYNLLFLEKTVTTLLVDKAQRVWVGTNKGLYRFDGLRWKSFLLDSAFIVGALPKTTPTADSLTTPPAPTADLQANLKDSLTPPSDTLSHTQDSLPKQASIVSDTNKIPPSAPNPSLTQSSTATTLALKQDSLWYITDLVLRESEIWIATRSGLFRYRQNQFARRGQDILPTQNISSLATHPQSKDVFVALQNIGIAHYVPARGQGLSAKWRIYTKTDGLLDSSINNLVLDSYGHVWVAHPGGVSHYTLNDWQRFNFNNQTVHSIELSEEGDIWIGTNKGVWKHSPAYSNPKGRAQNKTLPDNSGSQTPKGAWVHYHSGNALNNNNDLVIESQGDDVWFVTDAGVERYNAARTQVGLFYESLLPKLQLDDLFHAFTAITTPLQDWGTVGGFVNFISFGEITYVDENNEEKTPYPAREIVAGLSYGTKIARRTALGVNLKLIYSALAPDLSAAQDQEDAVAYSFALDAGLLWKKIYKGLSIGLVLQNMGPAVFYVDRGQTDPLPFTWKLGFAYELLSSANHRLTAAADFNRETFYIDFDTGDPLPVYEGAWKGLIDPFNDNQDHGLNEILSENLGKTIYNLGMEYVYANTFSLRTGGLIDSRGKRNEIDVGAGFLLSDVLQVDLGIIYDAQGIRGNQVRASTIIKF